jgi:hypothetical protein
MAPRFGAAPGQPAVVHGPPTVPTCRNAEAVTDLPREHHALPDAPSPKAPGLTRGDHVFAKLGVEKRCPAAPRARSVRSPSARPLSAPVRAPTGRGRPRGEDGSGAARLRRGVQESVMVATTGVTPRFMNHVFPS